MPARRTASRQRRTADERTRDADVRGDEEEDVPAGESEDGPAGDDDNVTAARGGDRMSAATAAQAGKRGLLELVGKQAEGVTAVEPTEDGWLVGVEVLEDQRVPSSADLLALYEVELDPDGTLVSYRRTRRYPRGRGDNGGDR
jgi:hypothetical protein